MYLRHNSSDELQLLHSKINLLLSVYLPSCSSRRQTNQQECIAFKCNYGSHYNTNNSSIVVVVFFLLSRSVIWRWEKDSPCVLKAHIQKWTCIVGSCWPSTCNQHRYLPVYKPTVPLTLSDHKTRESILNNLINKVCGSSQIRLVSPTCFNRNIHLFLIQKSRFSVLWTPMSFSFPIFHLGRELSPKVKWLLQGTVLIQELN